MTSYPDFQDDSSDNMPDGTAAWYPEGDESASETQALLDLAYDQLDGFVLWLEEAQRIETRGAQQDCFNAESLLDYLATHFNKAGTDINEFELRWFLFSHYIRKALADAETSERLPVSLGRFYTYLVEARDFEIPSWMTEALGESAYYAVRRNAFARLDAGDERNWEHGYKAWCEELEHHLDARCLLHPRELDEEAVWGESMGWREATLRQEANLCWQNERTAMLKAGMDFSAIRPRLVESYLQWIHTPQERLGGRSPLSTILEERAEAAGAPAASAGEESRGSGE